MAAWARALPRRTALNSAAILCGEAISRLATFLVAVIVARRFGPAALGQYGYALALASILLLVPDLGLHLLATRELATEPSRLRDIFWGLHWLKLPLVAAVAAFTLLFGGLAIDDGGRRVLLYVLVARSLLQSFSQAYMAVFKAFERMHYIGIQQFANAALTISSAAICLALHASLVTLVATLVLGQAVETWLGWRIVQRRFDPGDACGWDRTFLSNLLFPAAPIGITAILQALNLRLDVLVLSFFAPNQELGRFQAAAWSLVGTFIFASLLTTVIFPKLSKLLREPSDRGSAYVDSLLKHGILLVTVASLALWVGAPYILRWLFGSALASAADLLRILAPALPFMFMNTVLFYVFVAARRRAVYLGTLALRVGLGAILGFYLASRYGAMGSAVADLVREFVVTAVFLYFVKREALAPAVSVTLLKISLVAASLALVVRAFAGFIGPWAEWPAVWNLLMLGGTLIFVGLPNRQELLLLADESL